MDNGWIKLHRKLLDNPIFGKPELLQLFIYCLLKANHEPKMIIFNGQEIEVTRGQFITGRNVIARDLKQKPKTTYNRLQILKNVEILDIKTTNKFSLVTITNYELYQSQEEKRDSKKDNQRTTRGQPEDTNKNDKNDKEVKKDIYIVLFDYWNSKNIIVHRKLTDKIKRKISGTLENYSEEEIKNSIDNYDTILKGDRYYWTYKWTFEDFLQRGIEKFMTDACFENYKTRSDEKQDKSPNNLFLEADV